MTRIIEADEMGTIHLAGELLGVKPHARYAVDQENGMITVRPVEDNEETTPGDVPAAKPQITYPPHWHELTPQQRADRFLQLARRQPPSDAHLTDEQLRRENIYE